MPDSPLPAFDAAALRISTPATGAPARTSDPTQARRAAENFEAVFLSAMFRSMFTDLHPNGPFGGGSAEKMYRSQLYQELGRIVARSGGVGITDAVQRVILQRQESADGTTHKQL